MKRGTQYSRKGFIQRMIPIVLISVLFSVSFHSCQKDESILSANSEADVNQSGQLKSATISTDDIDALILKIENYVITGHLEPGIANSLISKLENAKKSLEKGNEIPAMNQLQAVINELEDLIGAGTIDAAIGEELIYDVKVITGECTYCGPPLIDARDNRVYQTVLIGDQLWMAENLAYETETGSWAYDNDENNVDTYGRLYSWEAAKTAAPDGWHLPSDAEWTELENYLIDNGYAWEGATYDYEIAQSLAATYGWVENSNPGAPGYDLLLNNRSGFSGLPGGHSGDNGVFNYVGYYGYWWSDTETSYLLASYWLLRYYTTQLERLYTQKDHGHSIRCVRD
jgi:uncharacterized protein (TIGR02145 family)